MPEDFKKSPRKSFLVLIAAVLSLAVILVLVVGLYLRDNPFANLVLAAAKTADGSFKLRITESVTENGFLEEYKSEYLFLENFSENGFAQITETEFIYTTNEYVYRKNLQDGSESIKERQEEKYSRLIRKSLEYLSDSEYSEIAKLLNRELFEREIFEEDEFDRLVRSIAFELLNENNLEEKLGFSESESANRKTYSFENDIKSLSRFLHGIVSESEYAFTDSESHKLFLETLNVIYELKLKIELELVLVLEDGYIKSLVQNLCFYNETEISKVLSYSVAFSDYENTKIDEEYLLGYERLKKEYKTKEK